MNEEKKKKTEIKQNWKNLPEDMKSLDTNLKQIGAYMKKSFQDWSGYLENIQTAVL